MLSFRHKKQTNKNVADTTFKDVLIDLRCVHARHRARHLPNAVVCKGLNLTLAVFKFNPFSGVQLFKYINTPGHGQREENGT